MSVEVAPSGWAGGTHVCIPGAGVGRVIMEGPRVIEIDLPAPECAVVIVDGPTGPRAVVLADPRVPYDRTLRAIAAARLLEDTAAGEALDTPAAAAPTPGRRPQLRLVTAASPAAPDTCCESVG